MSTWSHGISRAAMLRASRAWLACSTSVTWPQIDSWPVQLAGSEFQPNADANTGLPVSFTSTPPKPVEPTDPEPIEPPVDPTAPQPVIDAPREAEVNQEVTFDGSASQSAAEITDFTWDLGEGSTANGETVTHAYSSEGSYQVVLTVTDANNMSNSTTWVITISPAPPEQPDPRVAVIIAPPDSVTGVPTPFDGTASISDAGITSYQWDMGNGVLLEGGVVTNIFTEPGNFTVTLTVTDAFGQSNTTTWDIMIYAAVVAPPEVSQPIATPSP